MNNIIKITIIILSLSVGFISFQNYLSFRDQIVLTLEWGKEDRKIDPEVILSLNLESPLINITHTTLPISTIKALYTSEVNIDTTIKLLHAGIKENQFIGVSEFTLGQLYRKQKNKDSSLYYGRLSVKKLPNYIHVSNYINSLQKFKEYDLADSLYNNYLEKFKETQGFHKPYLFNKILQLGNGNDSLIKYCYSLYKKFKNEDYFDIYLQSKYGIENLAKSIVAYDKGNKYFENSQLEKSLSFYREAIDLIPEKWEYIENAGIINFKLNDFENSKKYFKIVNDSLNKKSENSLFYAAIIKLVEEDTLGSCLLLNRAAKLNHKGSLAILERGYCKN